MPKPFRGQISGSSPTGMLIRASKDVWCRGLYRRLGPEEFYRRRLAWLLAHGKTTSYNRLVAYLRVVYRQNGHHFGRPVGTT